MKKVEEVEGLYKIESFIQRINSLKELVIIVEGKSDKEMLELIGFKKEILVYNNRNFWRYISDLPWKKRDILVLTDYDREGENICKRLSEYAKENGLHIKNELRRRFRELTWNLGFEIYDISKAINHLRIKYQYNSI
jgi:5S rRNA maturation endonuclease (ribonuclease M5)